MADAALRDDLDILYVIGGNGTIQAAEALCASLMTRNNEKARRIRVVAAPKTMDNDVSFTDITFGFRTTVANAVELIRRIHADSETCERIGIVELFGAASGFVALHAGYASGECDYVLIPEQMRTDPKAEVDRAIERLVERYRKRKHAIIVVAEGASLAFLNSAFVHGQAQVKDDSFEKLVKYLQEGISQRIKEDAPSYIVNKPMHLIRSTSPDSADIDLCKQTGKLMVDTALSGMGRCVVALWHNAFVAVPMALAATKRVDVGSYYFLSMAERYLI
jgi:6-phosphofructokinase 1